MPELPEVETIRRIIEPQLMGKSIRFVEVFNNQIIAYPDPEKFCITLENQTILEINRRGNFITIHFESGARLSVHLRMTGQLLVMNESEPITSTSLLLQEKL